jgi:hypothetical protein
VRNRSRVKAEGRKPITIAHLRNMGEYGGIPSDDYTGHLYGLAKGNGLVRDGTPIYIHPRKPKKVNGKVMFQTKVMAQIEKK